MPERIDASAEEVAGSLMSCPSKKDWRYAKRSESE